MPVETAVDNLQLTENKSCIQEGYLPVPLKSVPPQSLKGLEVYIFASPSYSLYKSIGLKFEIKDHERLIEAGTDYVYIAVKDHNNYFAAIENSLNNIINDKKIALRKKCEILYATTLALANEISRSNPTKKVVNQIRKVTENSVKLVLKNPSAFRHLFSISNHDFFTATHSTNVSVMLLSFACNIGISEPQILKEIGTGALLHDTGKIFIPQDLLNYKEKLNEEQLATIRSHVEKGAMHLRAYSDLSEEIIRMTEEHHERMDGTGYPKRLRTKQISVYGRMLAIVDSFEAMTSVRPYREGCMSVEQAMDMINDMAPSQLDEKIVESFCRFIESNLLSQNEEITPNIDYGILKALGLAEKDKENPSGRRHRRFYFRVRSSLQIVRRKDNRFLLSPEHLIIAHNISQSGIGFLCTREYNHDDIIRITINIHKDNKKITFLAKIVRCLDHADGWFTLGAQFIEEKSSENIHDIHSSLR